MSHTLAQMLVFRGVMGFAGGNFLTRDQTGFYRVYSDGLASKRCSFSLRAVVRLRPNLGSGGSADI